MPINAISTGSPAAAVASAPAAAQSLRQTNEISQASRQNQASSLTSNQAIASNDQETDRNNAVLDTQRVQAAQPTLNTRGETVGSTINEVA